MGPVRTPRVGTVQARQDQPELLDVGSERADRRVLRRHRDLQRPDRRRDRRTRASCGSCAASSPRSSTTATSRSRSWRTCGAPTMPGTACTYVSAVAIEEKSVWDYNQGNPSGDPATLGQLAPPSTPLVAVYPNEGTLVNDHPYAILDAPWVERRLSERSPRTSSTFVQAPDQQARFQAAGFRDFRGTPGAQIVPSNGLLPDQPKLDAADAIRSGPGRDPALVGRTCASARACSWCSTSRDRWTTAPARRRDASSSSRSAAAHPGRSGRVRPRRRGRTVGVLQRAAARRRRHGARCRPSRALGPKSRTVRERRSVR